jgi:hypothetical protein
MKENAVRSLRGSLMAALVGLIFLGGSAGPRLGSGLQEAAMHESSSFLVDDFSGITGASAIGTPWRMFTDQVMGGISIAVSKRETVEGRPSLRLQGQVSLKNSGGFIQVALSLEQNGRPFDAGEFKGLRISVRGNGKKYHIHLRTAKTRLPWQYYSAAFDAGAGWKSIEIPFDRFKPENLKSPMDTRKLERIAVVAIGEEFQADVAVSRLEFYR